MLWLPHLSAISHATPIMNLCSLIGEVYHIMLCLAHLSAICHATPILNLCCLIGEAYHIMLCLAHLSAICHGNPFILNLCCLIGEAFLAMTSQTGSFAFVYFEDERDAKDAIRGLDNIRFGYERRRLSVEWAKGERGSRHRDGNRANQWPTKTLFVINFDPVHTRTHDIERHFEPYGKVLQVRIRRNFAFVQFETQEDATGALQSTHMSKILDRMVSVEYALRDDSERDDRRDSPRGGGYGRLGDSPNRRSLSPFYRRSRPSPDFGRAWGRSPDYDRYNGPGHDRYRSPPIGRYQSYL
ncbi:RNA recognition motif domain [Dillenia turbinata]|uniref:RNA recognition motif domain n=1 Tax=Dillenia turbinata TaxID=194707 RepID=A0AAN8UXQ4_9MAGN